MDKTTLNFDKTIIHGPDITLDDIYPDVGGEPTGDNPEQDNSAGDNPTGNLITSTTEDPAEDPNKQKDPGEEVNQEPEKEITLDDIYGGEGNEDPEGEDPSKTGEIPSDVFLDGIRAVLVNKMKRHNVDTTKVDLAEMTEEELVDFEEELDAFLMKNKYDSIKEQVDPNVSKLWNFIENGGDPKEWKKLYESQEEVSNIDISTDEGKLKKISSYYKEVRGWGQDQINKKLDRIKNTNTLEDEFEEVDSEYSAYFENKQEDLIQRQEEERIERTRIETQRKLVFQEKLDSSNLPAGVRSKVFDVAFRSGKIKGTDKITTVLDYTIQQMQQDPERYLKLAHFLADPEAYDQFILQNKKNATVVEGMKRGFEAVSKNRAPINQSSPKKPTSRVKLTFN